MRVQEGRKGYARRILTSEETDRAGHSDTGKPPEFFIVLNFWMSQRFYLLQAEFAQRPHST